MFRSQVLIAAAALFVCGCGSDLVTVTGTVEREGSPLPAGRVVMTPVGGGHVALGEIQFDGSFRLESEGGRDGAAPGNYRARVVEKQITETGLLRMNHRAPRDATVEIAAGAGQAIEIHIRRDAGWVTDQDN